VLKTVLIHAFCNFTLFTYFWGKSKGTRDREISKDKVHLHAMKAYVGSRGTAPTFLNLVAGCRWLVKLTPRELYLRERTTVPEASWPRDLSWTFCRRESSRASAGFRIPDCPARSLVTVTRSKLHVTKHKITLIILELPSHDGCFQTLYPSATLVYGRQGQNIPSFPRNNFPVFFEL